MGICFKVVLAFLLLCSAPAIAGDAVLKFDIARLCEWQATNNSMNPQECGKLETAAQAALPLLEQKADDERKKSCTKETGSFSGDSGYASYWVYANCLKDGPGAL